MQPETATSGRSADALMAATAMSLASLRHDARSQPGLAVRGRCRCRPCDAAAADCCFLAAAQPSATAR